MKLFSGTLSLCKIFLSAVGVYYLYKKYQEKMGNKRYEYNVDALYGNDPDKIQNQTKPNSKETIQVDNFDSIEM